MGRIICDLSVSLDGFVAGPDDGPQNPLGRGGEALFAWMTGGPEANRMGPWFTPPDASKVVMDEWLHESGAIISGRRTFDIANGWKHGHPIDVPIFVMTHKPPTEGEWSPRVSFVTGGIHEALDKARAVAGDKYISLSGAHPVQQLLQLGLIDEIQLHVTPILLGAGVRLFDHLGGSVPLDQLRAIESVGVTHLRYRVHNAAS